MKKILSITLVLLILVIGQSFANAVETLTLEETYEILKENNTDLKLLDEKIALDELRLEKARISAKNNLYIGKYLTADEYMDKVLIRDYNVQEIKVEIQQRKRAKEDKMKSLRSKVYSKYLDLNGKGMSKRVLLKELEQLKDDQRIVEAKLAEGMAVDLTLEKVKNEMAVKENQIKSIERSMQNTIYEFNQILGLPIETKIETRENMLIKTVNGDLMNAIATIAIEPLVEEQSSIINAVEDLELLELRKSLIDDNIGDDNDRYDDVVEDIVDQKDLIANAKKEVTYDVYSAINTLNQSRNNYLTAKNSLVVNEKMFSIDMVKYRIGQITFNERIGTYNDMYNQYIKSNDNKQIYLTQLEDFKIKYLTEEEETSPF